MTSSQGARFDSVQAGAADAEGAAREYALLLGLEPIRLHSGAWRFQLPRGAVEIEAGPAGLRSLRFAVAAGATRPWPGDADLHGLEVRTTPVVAADATEEGRVPAGGVHDTAPSPDCPHAIDHVVVRSTDLGRAISLWRDRLGLRLALDREFPGRGLRMLFFRSAGVTLEFVSAIGAADPLGRDVLSGLAYAVRDLSACRARLLGAGLDVSALRDGHKPGTRVATVRSGTAGIPTLLIEHPEPGGPTR